MALENHIFYLFGPYSALINPSSGQSIEADGLTFGQTFQLRPETWLI